jgi:hypothetical protein
VGGVSPPRFGKVFAQLLIRCIQTQRLTFGDPTSLGILGRRLTIDRPIRDGLPPTSPARRSLLTSRIAIDRRRVSSKTNGRVADQAPGDCWNRGRHLVRRRVCMWRASAQASESSR